MQFQQTIIPDLMIIEPRVFEDERGYFFESFKAKLFEKHGIESNFIQDNQALSKRAVIRGLHFQHEPYAQGKLIRVLSGEILDVAVDIRKGSPTFGLAHSVVLNSNNRLQLWVPRGFAHGYSVLSDYAEVFYKCDNHYSPQHEGGISPIDSTLKIDWRIPSDEMILSEKDKQYPDLQDAEIHFVYQSR